MRHRIHLAVLESSPAKSALLAAGRIEDQFLVVNEPEFLRATRPFNRWKFGYQLHRVLWPIWVRLGGSMNCGCARRAEALNAFGAWLRRLLARVKL